MKKGTRYLLAILACIVIFFVYVIFQETIPRGMLFAVLFVFAKRFVWKKIVGPKKEEDEKLRNDLMELIQVGYEVDAHMNLGDGWEPYEGCQQNLLMILEDSDTHVSVVGNDNELYEEV